MAGDAIDPSYDDDDFEVSDDDDVEMASAVKPRPEEIRGTHSKVASTATAPGGKTPGARRPSGSLTADLRSVAAVNASSPARGSSAGQPRAVALLARRSASKDSTVKKKSPPPPTTNATVRPKIPSDTAQMRLSSAFEKTLDTWHDRDGVAAENLALRTQIDAQLAEMAGLTLKCQSLEAAARADRERAADHAAALEDAVNKERKLRVEAERAAADVKATSTPWGQMAKGAMDVRCVSVEEAESMRREIQTQDAIMRGYQKENEAATATIAAMRREFAVKEGDFTGTIDRLNGEIARLRLETERTGGDGARYLERQLAAESALKAAQAEFGERERELVRERDAARAAARAAEAKMAGGGGMDPGDESPGGESPGVEAAQLAELERRHGARVAELEKRIAWFTENQELVADRDANLRRQAARIEELDRELARARRELAKFQPAAGVSSRIATPGSTPGKPADVRDVSSAGVASLLGGIDPGTDVTASAVFDAGLAKNPQSVAALVRAVRPTEAHVEKIAALEARCRRLQDELDATDGEHERALRALQQEHLKFKSNMERRVREAEEFGRDAQGLGGPRAVGAKPPGTKALERQVHELQGEVDTLRARLRDAEAAAAVRTGPVSERPAAPARRKPPKRSASSDKENADAAAAVAAVAASPVFKAPVAHNPLANDPLPEGHPAVTPFDPTGAGASPFKSRPLIRDSREGFPQPNDGDIAAAAARAAAEVARSFASPRQPRAPATKSPAKAATVEAKNTHANVKAKNTHKGNKQGNNPRVSWNAELEAERTYVPSPTEDTKASIARAGADDVELDSPVKSTSPIKSPIKSASPEVKRGGRRLDAGDKVITASPKKGVQHREMPKLPPVPANFPEAFVERLKRLEERAEARERYWKGVVREVQRVASEDSAELRKRCQAAVDGKNEQIRYFRERLNAIVATVHEQSLRRSVESGVGALEALAV
ncbi:predicted protein [Micromonas commoda]|uniref:Centrosomal protein of 162 kDa n=1 Tax=Micromonas commoda (strain RCC299 / NOUM17 / CCMP2709) TaxID=296587 RepID=C1EFT1_MICCC|nr:predicted protein [Micromonas commoda]ACO66651.1 predicted protein [Micromonas commoda]|eukprot:XP_002505393.1 predicted protein [Micromonas commoda]